MKRGPQPKRVFSAEQSRARAARIRALAGVLGNARVQAGLEKLATKFDQRAASLENGTRNGAPASRNQVTQP